MDPALAQEPVHVSPLRHIIARLAGELSAEAVGGEFGFAGAFGVAEVPVGDLVTGEQGELVRRQPGRRAFGKGDVAGQAAAIDRPPARHGKAGQAGPRAAVRLVDPALWQALAGDAQRDAEVIGRQLRRAQQGREE